MASIRECRVALGKFRIRYEAGSSTDASTGRLVLNGYHPFTLRPPFALVLFLAGCSTVEVPQEPGPYRASAAQSVTSSAPEPPLAAEPAPVDAPLPPTIPLGASSTHIDSQGRPSATVSTGDGHRVDWTHSELRPTPLPFKPEDVETVFNSADYRTKLWSSDREDISGGTISVGIILRRLPADALFVELAPADSLVIWSDGSRGTVNSIWRHTMIRNGESWLDLTTSPPPRSSHSIRSIEIALDLHQPTRLQRYQAQLRPGDSAAFDFGVLHMEWHLSDGLYVTEFGAGHYGKPVSPYYQRGLYCQQGVDLRDDKGTLLQGLFGGGAGSQSINTLTGGGGIPLAPPLHVRVDVPEETATSRVLVRLTDLQPQR